MSTPQTTHRYIIFPYIPHDHACAMNLPTARNLLGHAIAKIADESGVEIWFHEKPESASIIPSLMIECTAAFLYEINHLPYFKKAESVWSITPSKRSDDLLTFYRSEKAKVPIIEVVEGVSLKEEYARLQREKPIKIPPYRGK